MRKKLNFSNRFLKAEYLENEKALSVKNYGIFLNLGNTPIRFDKSSLVCPYKSYLFKNYDIQQRIKRGVLLTFNFDPARNNPDLNIFCKSNWDANKVRFPDDPTKWKFKILRSSIEKIDNLEFNCWFLPSNTASSIHNEHPFKEVHTQVYGLGIMNKFREQDYKTLYQRMYMPAGFTHDFFFDKNVKYPWHQYEAVTNSIWMAVCEY